MATLLIIARGNTSEEERGEVEDGWVVADAGDEEDGGDDDGDLDKLVLWVEIQKQVAILREGMEKRKREEGEGQ